MGFLKPWSCSMISFLSAVLTGLTIALDNGLGRTGPAMGWSSWNYFGNTMNNSGSHCHCPLGAAGLMQIADALVATGLRDKGYRYVNQDGGWAIGRNATTGELIPDPTQFPNGLEPVIDYIHSKGLLFGLYTDRGSSNCRGVPTGSDGHETVDAQQWARWGVDYVKDDSCGGHTYGTVWDQYVRMRDALNGTGRPIWYSITQLVDYDDGWDDMHCVKGSTSQTSVKSTSERFRAFTTRPWVFAGKDVTSLANSFLVEYCNNQDKFGATGSPGGFLSQLDAQQLLTWDNLTVPGAFNDMDMMEMCHTDHGSRLSTAEARAQFSTFAILSSPLILGNDPRNMSAECISVVGNEEVIALNQDPLVMRAPLVWQYPDPAWPHANDVPANGTGYPTMDPSNVTSKRTRVAYAPPHITLQAWARPLANGDFAVVILNRDERGANATVDWSWLGEHTSTALAARNLWQHKEMGIFNGGSAPLVVHVQPHDVVALRLRKPNATRAAAPHARVLPHVPYANATRVLPLGDSITFGCGDQCDQAKNCMAKGGLAPCSNCSAGYRGPLWASLAEGKAGDARSWTFVGTQSNGAFAAPLHEGHPGWTITQLHSILPNWAQTQPDIVLLHAGTNDLGGYVKPVATAQDAAERMRALLNSTFAALPRVHVVLASLIGATKHYGGSKHAEFNALLPNITAKFAAAGFSIEFLDMAVMSGLGNNCDTKGMCCPYHIHPNDLGYVAMARVWKGALARLERRREVKSAVPDSTYDR